MPLDRSAVEDQLAAIGEGDRWWDRAEMRDLPSILQSGERILGVVAGKITRSLRPSGRAWLFVLTDQRLLGLRGGERLGRRQLEIGVRQITSLAHRSGLFRTKLTLTAAERRHRIRVTRGDSLKFIGALSAVINRGPAGVGAALVPAGMALVQHGELERVQERVDLLEDEVERLRQQIDFMEDLLRRRPDLGAVQATQTAGALGRGGL